TADLLTGRFFTHTEEQGGQNVVVLGYDVADSLFPHGPETALMRQVVISRIKFRVIGVMARQGEFLGLQSFDRQVVIPLGAMHKFHSSRWSNQLRVQALPDVSMGDARDELTGYMRLVRRLMPDEDNNFEINQSEAIEEQMGPIKGGITLAGFFITGL